jgi:hypothetical protein
MVMPPQQMDSIEIAYVYPVCIKAIVFLNYFNFPFFGINFFIL